MLLKARDFHLGKKGNKFSHLWREVSYQKYMAERWHALQRGEGKLHSKLFTPEYSPIPIV